MSQIQISAPSAGKNLTYDPLLCKTCQKLGLETPRRARAPYSDCEEHFHQRVVTLLLNGGLRLV